MQNVRRYRWLMMILLVLGAASVAAAVTPDADTSGLTDVGNKICPVSGESVLVMGEGVRHVYQGRVYHLCCPACVAEFDQDPEKYSRIATAEAAAGTTPSGAPQQAGMEQGRHPRLPIPPAAVDQDPIAYYTCGMHPSVKVSPQRYAAGETTCPICAMPLVAVKSGAGAPAGEALGEDVVSRVEIPVSETQLAGVATEPVARHRLFQEIRAVGQVAYDPELAVAQDEFLAALKSLAAAEDGGIPDVVDRAAALVGSSKKKLLLLGMSEPQVQDLRASKAVQQALVQSEDAMWVYGDIFEYEIPGLAEGAGVKVLPVGSLGQEFSGRVVAINPVIDAQTRSLRFRALVDNPGRVLRPGMAVEVDIRAPYRDPDGNPEVVAVPANAVLDTGRRVIVWVEQGPGRYEGRRVRLGPELIDDSGDQARFYPVLKGVAEGERVVTRGNFLIDSQSQISGVAASAYGGALGKEGDAAPAGMPAGHRH